MSPGSRQAFCRTPSRSLSQACCAPRQHQASGTSVAQGDETLPQPELQAVHPPSDARLLSGFQQDIRSSLAAILTEPRRLVLQHVCGAAAWNMHTETSPGTESQLSPPHPSLDRRAARAAAIPAAGHPAPSPPLEAVAPVGSSGRLAPENWVRPTPQQAPTGKEVVLSSPFSLHCRSQARMRLAMELP